MERAIGSGLRMVVFDSRSASAHTRSLTTCAGVPGAPRTTSPRFEVRELGEMDMVSRARAMLELVAHDGTGGQLAGAFRELAS